MAKDAGCVQGWLERWASEPYAYLTTIGRRTGRPHRIEIWFGVEDGHLFLMSGGRDRADWVRNLQANSRLEFELGDETHSGVARILQDGTAEDLRARGLLVGKYQQSNELEEWGRTSLAITVEFIDAGEDPFDHE